MIAWWGTEGVQALPQTPEELQSICVHVWRDQSEIDWVILQECIRCKKTRSLSLN